MASKGPECSICFERYNDENKCPRLLSCGHSFCSCCLERLLRGNTIDCPKCRNPVAVPSGVHGLLKNFALPDIVNETAPKQHAGNTGHTGTHECEACGEKHPANFCCLDCKENMCKTAAQFHKRSKTSRDHRVVSLEELKANPQLASVSVLCPEHNDQFRFFDQDCGRVICRDCYALNHSGHKCVIVAEAASKYRQEMEALVTKASSQVEKIKAAEVQVMEEVLLMDGACVKQREKIQGFFRELHSALSNREQVLIDKLSSIHQQKKSILTEQLGRLRVNQTFLESVVQRAKSSIQSLSDVQFLLSRPDLVSTLKTERSYSMVLDPEAQFLPEFTKSEEERMPVKYRCNKSIEAVIKSAGDISDISTCAANTTATGPGITTASRGRKATFTITSHDSRNFQRKRGGDVFVVKLKPEVRGDDIKVELKVSNSIGLACSGKEIYHFCFVLLCIRGQIPSTSPPGACIRRGDLTEGFLLYDFGGLIFGGVCTWRGLFSEFYGI
ncbi:unnamed protein product [Porites lobata]|uniref:Uncharacterized protein n=1 Tax=Porites lobata TaxID=104759 RepID=A0ABN8S1S1_9CNID|nr:unnamed protein product [Porites lobata]